MKLLAFSDLHERGIMDNRVQMQRAIDQYGFPPGRLITPNSRRWTEEEVIAWVESRPTGGRPERRKRETAGKMTEAA